MDRDVISKFLALGHRLVCEFFHKRRPLNGQLRVRASRIRRLVTWCGLFQVLSVQDNSLLKEALVLNGILQCLVSFDRKVVNMQNQITTRTQ